MTKRYINTVIFWGALWGLEEATLGHLLHITTLSIGWFLWFPLAYFFMRMVYKQTGKLNSILFISIIATAIKCIDLFTAVNPIIVVCPAISILLEGISLLLVLGLLAQKKGIYSHKVLEVVSASLFWRVLFLIALLAIPVWIMPAYPYKGIAALSKFAVYQGLINGLFIYATIILLKKASALFKGMNTPLNPIASKLTLSEVIAGASFKPFIPFSLLIVSILVQWMW